MPRIISPQSRRLALPLAAIAAALLLAACGSSSPPNTTSASTSALKFAECMRANGVPNFPDPSQGSGGGVQIQSSQGPNGQTLKVNGVPINAPAFQSAQTKCQKDMPQGKALSASQVAKLKAGALAMAKCMRAHGITNFPDPVVSVGPGGHGVGVRIGVKAGGSGGPNPQAPAFQAASKTCQPLMLGPGARVPVAP